LVAAIGEEFVHVFNDRQRNVKPVLAAFDRAIGEPAALQAGCR